MSGNHKPEEQFLTLTAEELRVQAKERAIIEIVGIAQRIAREQTQRDGEDVLIMALERWNDTSVV